MIAKIKKELRALFLAYRNPATPWYAKLWAVLVVAYALSPIDLIPDFIPVLGYLDDIILVPIGIAVAVRLIPKHIMDECRKTAAKEIAAGRWNLRKNWAMAAVFIVVWLLLIALLVKLLYRPVLRLWHR